MECYQKLVFQSYPPLCFSFIALQRSPIYLLGCYINLQKYLTGTALRMSEASTPYDETKPIIT